MMDDNAEFESRMSQARSLVNKARGGEPRALADALRELGNIERRRPDRRDEANEHYAEAADIYRALNRPLDEAWVTRHIGINHEYAERFIDAETAYEKALELYRNHSENDDLDYANAVRYVAVIKMRLFKTAESETLWQEAVRRYEQLGIADGVAEGMDQLSNLLSARSASPDPDERTRPN